LISDEDISETDREVKAMQEFELRTAKMDADVSQVVIL
jgi:hypothetical protein